MEILHEMATAQQQRVTSPVPPSFASSSLAKPAASRIQARAPSPPASAPSRSISAAAARAAKFSAPASTSLRPANVHAMPVSPSAASSNTPATAAAGAKTTPGMANVAIAAAEQEEQPDVPMLEASKLSKRKNVAQKSIRADISEDQDVETESPRAASAPKRSRKRF